MEDRELTLKDLLLIFRKRQLVFWTVVVLSVLATGVYLLVAKPQYEAVVKIRVSPATGGIRVGSSTLDLLLGGVGTGGGLQDEIELILSRRNLLPVIEELGLVEKLMKKEDIEKALKRGLAVEDLSVSLYGYLVNKKIVNVKRVRDANLLEVKFSCSDPTLASKFANRIVENYLKIRGDVVKDQSTLKREYIDRILPQFEVELLEAQERLRIFKEKNKIYAVETQLETLIEKHANLLQKMEESRIGLDAAKVQLSFLSDQLKRFDVELEKVSDSVTFDPIVTQLKNRILALQVEIAGLSEKYPTGNAELRQKRAELEETKKQLEEELERLITSQLKKTLNPVYQETLTNYIKTEVDRILFQVQHEAFRKLYEDMEKELAKLPSIEKQLIELERDYRVKEAVYTALLQSKYQTLVSEVGAAGVVSVVDWAIPPLSPSKPDKKLSLALGGALGVFLGIFLVFLLEATDKRIGLESEAEHYLNGDRIVARVPLTDDLAKAKKALGIAAAKAGKVILLTSLEDGAGKTFLSSCLASLLSEREKVLLVSDSDVPGDFEKKDLNVILKKPELMDSFREGYDRVVVDAPTVDALETLLLAKRADTVYVVVRLEHTLRESLKLLSSLEKVDGFILNGLTRKNSSYPLR